MKKIVIIALLAGLTTIGSSCKKWLDLKPLDGIVREEFWRSKEQVEAAVNGIYASMLTTGNQGMAELFFIWGEARTDMVSPGFRASSDELDIVNLNILPANNFANWRVFYQTINYCNTVIELAPGVKALDNTFTDEMLNRAVGEALTIRALMYFYLVRTFRDVPLKLDATKSDEDIAPIPASGSDVVLNQIVADLKKAEPFLPQSYGNIDLDKGRVTRFTANTLLADVYLWQDKYTECVTECDKVINSRRYGLVGGGNSMFTEIFFKGNSIESIFELQFDIQKLNPFYAMHIANTRRWGAAPHLMEEVFGVDAVNAVPLVDQRGDGTALRATDLTIWKYIGANNTGTSIRPLDQSFAHWIFYRYADVLLMKAEAINQLGRPLESSRIVKQIRERAGAFDFGSSMDSTSKSGMEEYILMERQREFAFEGKRWYDALRNAKRNNYARLDFLLNMAAISVPGNRQQSAFSKLRDKNSHYLPIFLYEMQTNKLLVQNPFYK
jgi:starch-binding outer membrane protein, SusD/RagB family